MLVSPARIKLFGDCLHARLVNCYIVTIVKDNIETGYANFIPLWTFGLMY